MASGQLVPETCGLCSGSTILERASCHGNVDRVKARLAAGDIVNYYSSKSPLQRAVENCHDDVAEVLIKAGAIVTYDVLQIAGESGSEKCVSLLLNVDLEHAIHGHDRQMLYYAAAKGRENIVDLLLKAGVEMNEKLYTRTKTVTAILAAAANGHVRCAKLLIEAEADVNIR